MVVVLLHMLLIRYLELVHTNAQVLMCWALVTGREKEAASTK